MQTLKRHPSTTTTTTMTFNKPRRRSVHAMRRRSGTVDDSQWFTDDDERGVILYDGVCNLCNSAVNFAIEYDADVTGRGSLRFAALQSDAGRAMLVRAGRDADDISSIVFVERGGVARVKSDAILAIAKRLRAPFPQLSALGRVFVPRMLGDAVYDLVANNRYAVLGKRDVCRLGDETHDDRFLS
jgi:predicted DCC family thiol-disulfide oxidoreductase YuxK